MHFRVDVVYGSDSVLKVESSHLLDLSCHNGIKLRTQLNELDEFRLQMADTLRQSKSGIISHKVKYALINDAVEPIGDIYNDVTLLPNFILYKHESMWELYRTLNYSFINKVWLK